MSMPTSEVIVSRYLYDEDTPPADLKDEKLIRPKDAEGRVFSVNVNEYMTIGAGRFVGVEEFRFVRNFLGGQDSAYLKDGGKLTPGVYSTLDILREYLITENNSRLSVSGYYRGVDEPDYADRAYVFGTGAYKINDDAVFIVNEDGSRSVSNIYVVPQADDFGYEGKGFLADILML